MTRRAELICGLLAGVLGALGLVYAIFGSTGAYSAEETLRDGTVVTTSGSTSIWDDQDLEPITIFFLTVILLNFVLFALGAWFHARENRPGGLTMMWTTAIVLTLGTLLSMLSIGLFLVPGTLLAVVAVVVAGTSRSLENA